MTVKLWFIFAIWTYICYLVIKLDSIKKADNYQRIMGFLFMMLFWYVAPVVTLIERMKNSSDNAGYQKNGDV